MADYRDANVTHNERKNVKAIVIIMITQELS